MTIQLKLHTLVRFDYETTPSSVPLSAWMIRLVAGNNIEYNMRDHKWYWQRRTVINDGDYIVKIHPKMLELARLQNGEDPRVKDKSEMFLQTIFGEPVNPEEQQWADGFGYGVMEKEKLDSLMRHDAAISESIDETLESYYAAIDGKKETRQ
jgi:hypothetical protein